MTLGFIGCRMTLRDFRVCQAILAGLAYGGAPLAAAMREKLDRAALFADDAIDPLVVTLNSRVDFGIDGEAPQRRILVGSAFHNGLVGMTLPVSTPRGLALLGLRQGQSATFEEGGTTRELTVLRLHYQPEAARWGRAPAAHPPPAPPIEIIDLARARQARAARGEAPGIGTAGDRAAATLSRKGTPS